MNRVTAKWAALRPDLRMHLVVGVLIALASTLALGLGLGMLPSVPELLAPLQHPLPAALAGLVLGERAGWLKEYVVDARGAGTLDRDDYLYTGRGAIAGAAIGAVLVSVLPALGS